MPFRYPLQPLLRLRQSMERQEEQKLLTLAAQVARLRADIQEFEDQQRESKRALQQEMAGGCSGAQLQFAALCEDSARSVRARLELDLRLAEQKRIDQLRIYHRARQDREILQGLRTRKEAAYETEATRREQQRTDEAFLIRHFPQPRS